MSERDPQDRDPQDQDPFQNLKDLIDEPVAPRGVFADELRSRLMRELSASDASREEHLRTMDAVIAPRPPLAFPIESPRRIRPMVILELAAAAIIVIGLAATLGRGWFGNDPDPATAIPAAALQGDQTPTPELQPEQTPTPELGAIIPTVAPDGSLPASPPADTMIPTVGPGGTFIPAGLASEPLWTLPGTDGDLVDFGGLLVEDGIVYRLLATTSFVGVQAVDGATGTVKWQQAYQRTGNLFALEEDTLYFDGGNNQLIAVDAETGSEIWRAQVEGNPIALDEADDRIFVLTDSDFVTALDRATGDQLWVAQGTVPQNPTGGSTSMPAIGKIAVEDGVVVAISTYGVLSGFDVQNGTELWAHEGYDSAMTTIDSESDHIVVSSGMGLSTVAVHVGSLDDSIASPSSGDDAQAHAGAASAECAQYFESSTEAGTTAAGAQGTVEGGASSYHLPGSTFQAQAIDPKTGDILWEQQTISGAAAATVIAANPAGPAMCTVDAETGAIGYGSGSSASNAFIMVGELGTGAPAVKTEDGTLIAVGTISGVDQQTIAAVAADGDIYLQLADGSLVKVAANGSAGVDDEHGDSEGTPEAGDD